VGVEFSAVPYATGAGGWGVGTAACPASAAAATPTPLARIVISNVSRLV